MKNECDKCLWFVHIPSVEDTERNPSLLEYPYKVIDNRICALGGCQNGNRFEERNKESRMMDFPMDFPMNFPDEQSWFEEMEEAEAEKEYEEWLESLENAESEDKE